MHTFFLPWSHGSLSAFPKAILMEKHFRPFVFSVHVFLQFLFIIMQATVHMYMYLTFVRDGCLAVRFLIVSSSEHW